MRKGMIPLIFVGLVLLVGGGWVVKKFVWPRFVQYVCENQATDADKEKAALDAAEKKRRATPATFGDVEDKLKAALEPYATAKGVATQLLELEGRVDKKIVDQVTSQVDALAEKLRARPKFGVGEAQTLMAESGFSPDQVVAGAALLRVANLVDERVGQELDAGLKIAAGQTKAATLAASAAAAAAKAAAESQRQLEQLARSLGTKGKKN